MALFDTTAFRILEQGAAVMWQRNKELNLATQLRIDKLTSDQGDRNNVDSDVQQAEMLKTQYQLDAIINQMNGNFTRIRSAIVTK